MYIFYFIHFYLILLTYLFIIFCLILTALKWIQMDTITLNAINVKHQYVEDIDEKQRLSEYLTPKGSQCTVFMYGFSSWQVESRQKRPRSTGTWTSWVWWAPSIMTSVERTWPSALIQPSTASPSSSTPSPPRPPGLRRLIPSENTSKSHIDTFTRTTPHDHNFNWWLELTSSHTEITNRQKLLNMTTTWTDDFRENMLN